MKHKVFKTYVKSLAICTGMLFAQGNVQQIFAQNRPGKICTDLLELTQEQKQAVKNKKNTKGTPSTDEFQFLNKPRIVQGEYVLIEAISGGNNQALIEEMEQVGLKNAQAFGGMVSGMIPISSINKLEGLKNLRFVRAVANPATSIGKTTTHGDKMQFSSVLRDVYGVDGHGVKIGTMSDSYNYHKGAAEGIASGDLPGAENPNGYTKEVKVLKEYTGSNAIDEGRGMIEIIHDVAPGAEHIFRSAFHGQPDFAQGIIELAEEGVDVINDDILYFSEPFFQDGVIAQAVDSAVKTYGISYFSAAGNQSNRSYESYFRPTADTIQMKKRRGEDLGSYVMHDFDKGEGVDIFQEVVISNKDRMIISLQWDQPFASVCEGCPGSESNLDLFLLFSEDPSKVVIAKKNNNIGGDAVERFSIRYNRTNDLVAYLAIGKKIMPGETNPNPKKIKYIDFGSGVHYAEYKPNAPTVMGHGNAEKCISVGGVTGFEYEGKFNYSKYSSSSLGGQQLLFDKKGNRYNIPKVRRNPDFVAPTGVNTTFFGHPSNDGDEFPNFYGTSASAPHAAAVFALLKQINGPERTKKSIERIMKETSVDMSSKEIKDFVEGYDYWTGYGRIDALQAAKELIKITGMMPLKIKDTCTANPEQERAWTVYNANPFNLQCSYTLADSDQQGRLVAKPGKTIITANTEAFNLLELSYTGPYDELRKTASYSHGNICSNTDKAAPVITDNQIFKLTKVYPMPLGNALNLEFYAGTEQQVHIKIFDVNGKVVFFETVEALAGYNQLNQRIENISPGIYQLQVQASEGRILGNKKLVKQ